MMKRGVITLVLLLAASQAMASLVLVDDATFGAGSVIRDLDHGRDFLNIGETAGMTFAEVSALLGTTFAGWDISTSALLDDLRASAGVIHSSTDPFQVALVDSVMAMFCAVPADCRADTSVARRIRGSVLDTVGTEQAAYDIGVIINSPPERTFWAQQGFSFTNPNQGVFLTRLAVPEPALLVLLATGLASLALARQRRT